MIRARNESLSNHWTLTFQTDHTFAFRSEDLTQAWAVGYDTTGQNPCAARLAFFLDGQLIYEFTGCLSALDSFVSEYVANKIAPTPRLKYSTTVTEWCANMEEFFSAMREE